MLDNKFKHHKISMALLRESVWGAEDKINVIMEQLADQEADLIRLKRLCEQFSNRLGKLELNQNRRNNGIRK